MEIDPVAFAATMADRTISRLIKITELDKEEKLLYLQACRTMNGYLRMNEIHFNKCCEALEEEEPKVDGG